MPVEVVRLADSSLSLKAQPSDMPHGGWCKPPERPVVMIAIMRSFDCVLRNCFFVQNQANEFVFLCH